MYTTYLQSSKYFTFTIIGFGVSGKETYHKFCILHCSKQDNKNITWGLLQWLWWLVSGKLSLCCLGHGQQHFFFGGGERLPASTCRLMLQSVTSQQNNLTSACQKEVVWQMYRLKKLHAKLKIWWSHHSCGIEITKFMQESNTKGHQRTISSASSIQSTMTLYSFSDLILPSILRSPNSVSNCNCRSTSCLPMCTTCPTSLIFHDWSS